MFHIYSSCSAHRISLYPVPTELYVVETIPPEEHPYSRKIIYIDTRDDYALYSECYDRRGEFWKLGEASKKSRIEASKGRTTAGLDVAIFRDLQNMHATTIPVPPHLVTVNDPDPKYGAKYFTTKTLLKKAR